MGISQSTEGLNRINNRGREDYFSTYELLSWDTLPPTAEWDLYDWCFWFSALQISNWNYTHQLL